MRLDRGVSTLVRSPRAAARSPGSVSEACPSVLGEVAQEVLDQRGLLGLQALAADDLVGDQEGRVRARGLGGVVELQRQVVAGALRPRRGHRLRRPTRRSARPRRCRCRPGRRRACCRWRSTTPCRRSEFLVLLTPSATPADFSLPSPVPVQSFPGSFFQAPAPAALQELGEVLGGAGLVGAEEHGDLVAGRVAPEFSLAIAGSFQVVIVPLKIFASTSGVEHQLVHAGDVVGEGDRADDHRQVQRRRCPGSVPWPCRPRPRRPSPRSSARSPNRRSRPGRRRTA